jgi:hypothetical protein
MHNLRLKTNPAVDQVFKNYPEFVRDKILNLRNLILETANEIEEIMELEETLKWGEPSYLAKKGSTVRIDWKEKNPDQYAIYFKCTSKLVPGFKAIFGNTFKFEGNRAIIFQLDDQLPEAELKQCMAAALTYHSVKHLPTLGLNYNNSF